MRVLILSNLDSSNPFGQFLRPFHLGRGLARLGVEVGNVAVDTSRIDFGPVWQTGAKSLVPLGRAARRAAADFRPDVMYAHEMRPATAALLAARGVPLCVDFHSVPSVEWAGYARGAPPRIAILHRAAAVRTGTAERLVARRADAVIAAGEEVAEVVQRLHRPATMPVVIPNGVDDALLDTTPNGPSPYPGTARSAVATVPGAQSPANARALAFLQAAAAALQTRRSPTSVHVLGSDDGPPAPGLRYEGFQPDLLPWVAHADVCLLPYPAEAALCGGARNKLLEYLARGRTIVSTREGLRGLAEVESWPGVTVTSDDPAAFADAVDAASAPGAATLEASRETLRRRLRWDSLAEQVRDVLARIAR